MGSFVRAENNIIQSCSLHMCINTTFNSFTYILHGKQAIYDIGRSLEKLLQNFIYLFSYHAYGYFSHKDGFSFKKFYLTRKIITAKISRLMHLLSSPFSPILLSSFGAIPISHFYVLSTLPIPPEHPGLLVFIHLLWSFSSASVWLFLSICSPSYSATLLWFGIVFVCLFCHHDPFNLGFSFLQSYPICYQFGKHQQGIWMHVTILIVAYEEKNEEKPLSAVLNV